MAHHSSSSSSNNTPTVLSSLKRASFAFGFNNEQFSDVELKLVCKQRGKRKRHESLLVNRLFLSGESEYFKSLFSNGMAETKKQIIELEIEEDEHKFFVDMIYAIFHGKFQSSHSISDIIKVLHQCDKYLVSSVAEACNEVLKDRLKTTEAAQEYFLMLEYSPHLTNPDVVEVAGKTLMDHFRNFEEGVLQKYCSYKLNGEQMDDKLKDFFALTPLALKEICKSSELRISSENAIFQAVMIWAKKYPDRDLESILMNVRYGCMTSDYVLDVVLNSYYVKKNYNLYEVISRIGYEKSCESHRKTMIPDKTKQHIPRSLSITSISAECKITRQESSAGTYFLKMTATPIAFCGYFFRMEVSADKNVAGYFLSLAESGIKDKSPEPSCYVRTRWETKVRSGSNWIVHTHAKTYVFTNTQGFVLVSATDALWSQSNVVTDSSLTLQLTMLKPVQNL